MLHLLLQAVTWELLQCAGNGPDGTPLQSPGTPSRSFNGSETLGAGLANLRAASQRSASTTSEDPEVFPAYFLTHSPLTHVCTLHSKMSSGHKACIIEALSWYRAKPHLHFLSIHVLATVALTLVQVGVCVGA